MAQAILVRLSLVRCITAFTVILLFSVPCEGETVVLTDDFNTGIHAWTYADNLDGSTDAEPGAVMSWDSREGNPAPGSLVLTTVEVSEAVEGYWALGPCMASSPHDRWRTKSMVKKTGSVFGHCDAYVSHFFSSDCTGEGTRTGSSANTPPIAPDVWHFRIMGVDFPSARSARPVLFMSVSPRTAIACHFDSIVVTNRGAAAPDVPTLSAVGLLIMATVLLALAVGLLARRRLLQKTRSDGHGRHRAG